MAARLGGGASRLMKLLRQISIMGISSWLALFVMLPLLLMLVVSFLEHDSIHIILWKFTIGNYQKLLSAVYFKILFRSLVFSLGVTAIVVLLAYPAAYFISCSHVKVKGLLLSMMIIPFWTSSLIRTYAIMAIIKVKGLLNTLLLAMGIMHQPLQILYSTPAAFIGMVYNLLPFMILPLYSNFEKFDHRVVDAARDLGANRLTILVRIIIPLTLPGIMAGVLFVFLPSMTLFYIPDLLGGAKSLLMGNLVENQFLTMSDWPGGAATSIILTLILLLLMWLYRRATKQYPAASELL